MGLVDFTAQRDPPRKLGLIVGLKLGLDGLMLGLKLGFDGIVDGIVVGVTLLGTIVDGLVELGLTLGLDGLALGVTDGRHTDSKVVVELGLTLSLDGLALGATDGRPPDSKVVAELGLTLSLDGIALGATDGPPTDSKVVVFETSITLWCSKLTEDGLTGSIPMGKVLLLTMTAESMAENTDSMRS